jgi:hypothetical protein
MVRIKLKYVVEDVDRHGNVRLYFRRKGQPKIRLRGVPGSQEFATAYQAALAGVGQAQQPRNIRPVIGSFGWACLNYYAIPTFKSLDPATQNQRRYFLDKICLIGGGVSISTMEPRHIEKLLETKRTTPAAAPNLLKSLKALFA